MKLKKSLIILGASLISVLFPLSVKADSTTFKPMGQQSIGGVTVGPFKTGDTTINVNLDPYGYVYGSVKHHDGSVDKIKAEAREVKTTCPTTANGCTERKWMVSGNRADGGGNYTVQLEKPLEEGDKVTLSFADDGNFHFGQLVFEAEKPQSETLPKDKPSEEQPNEDTEAEDMYLKYMEYDESKTWYQRFGDSIQDQ